MDFMEHGFERSDCSNDPAIQKIVQAAIESGTKRYISDCRHRIDYFCEVNYSFCGTLKIHKKAFTLIVRHP